MKGDKETKDYVKKEKKRQGERTELMRWFYKKGQRIIIQ